MTSCKTRKRTVTLKHKNNFQIKWRGDFKLNGVCLTLIGLAEHVFFFGRHNYELYLILSLKICFALSIFPPWCLNISKKKATAGRKEKKTVHFIVLIFSLLLDTEFLQSGVHVQLIGLQLPQECFPLCSQTDTQNMKKQKSPRDN